MSNSKKEKNTLRGAKVSPNNLQDLESLHLDPSITTVLQRLQGTINVSFTGTNATTSVTFREDGGEISIPITEFARIFNTLGVIQAARSREESSESERKFELLIAEIIAICVAQGDLDQLIAVDADRKAVLKQLAGQMKLIRDNLAVVRGITAGDPEIMLGGYLTSMCLAATEVVAGCMIAVLKGQRSYSEMKISECERVHLPMWTLNKLSTKKAVTMDTKPYLFFFPRKREKGIRISTMQLNNADFLDFHEEILRTSGALLKIVREPEFLQHVIGINGFVLNDENNGKLFEEFQWYVTPTMEGDIDTFLTVTAKNPIPIDASTSGSFSSLLAKVNTALLRTTQLQGSGISPGQMIAEVFFPSNVAAYSPSELRLGLFETLKLEENKEDLMEYIYLSTERAVKLFSNWLSVELRLPTPQPVVSFFFPPMEEVVVPVQEPIGDINVVENNVARGNVEPQVIEDNDPRLDRLRPPTGGLIHDGVLSPSIMYISGQRILQPGDQRYPTIGIARSRVFPAQPEAHGREARRVLHQSQLSRAVQPLAKELVEHFPLSEKRIIDFLRSFTSSRMQLMAAKKLVAQIDYQEIDNEEAYYDEDAEE